MLEKPEYCQVVHEVEVVLVQCCQVVDRRRYCFFLLHVLLAWLLPLLSSSLSLLLFLFLPHTLIRCSPHCCIRLQFAFDIQVRGMSFVMGQT